MIGVLVIGRLGNQLFQFVFAYELSERLQVRYFLKDENRIHQFYADRYFDLKGFSRLKNFFRRLEGRRFDIIRIDSDRQPEENIKKCKNGYLYHGFYQSEKYFFNHRTEIKELIKVKKKFISSFERRYPNFNSNKVLTIHIRGGDYKLYEGMSLGADYYSKALNKIHDLDKYKIWLVTDDISYARGILPSGLNFHYHPGSEIHDFLKIMKANVVIMANSSFSWWASYLNENSNKRIFAPWRWLGTSDVQRPNGILDGSCFIKIRT